MQEDLKVSNEVIGQKKLIEFHSRKTALFPVYKVNVSKLKYNKNNCRLANRSFSRELFNPDFTDALHEKIHETLAGNPISKKMIELARDIMKYDGLRNPLVVLKDGVIVSGNRRFTALTLILSGEIEPPEGIKIDLDKFSTVDAVIIDDDSNHKQLSTFYELQEQNDALKEEYPTISKTLGIYKQYKEGTDKDFLMETWRLTKGGLEKIISQAKIMLNFLKSVHCEEQIEILEELKLDAVVKNMPRFLADENNFSRDLILLCKNIPTTGYGSEDNAAKMFKKGEIFKPGEARNYLDEIIKKYLKSEKILRKISNANSPKDKAEALLNIVERENRQELREDFEELILKINKTSMNKHDLDTFRKFYKFINKKSDKEILNLDETTKSFAKKIKEILEKIN